MPRPRKSPPKEGTVSLPSSGTSADLTRLSTVLGLDANVIVDIMTCQGMGVRSRRGDAADNNAAGGGGDMAAMSNVWGDWMNEEMTTGAAASSTAATSSNAAKTETVPAPAKVSTSRGPRSYILPLSPSHSKPSLLLQTGTLDSTIPGRSSIPKQPRAADLECPTILTDIKFVKVCTSAGSCHSVGITEGEFSLFDSTMVLDVIC